MDLVYFIVFIGLAAVISVLVVPGSRIPVQPARATEGLVADAWCVAITGLIAFGTCFGVRFFLDFDKRSPEILEVMRVAAFSAG